MRLRRTTTALLTALALAAGALAAGAPAQAAPVAAAVAPAPGGYVPPPITWTPCPVGTGTLKTLECGRVVVPLDWKKPKGTTISLAVSRLLHTAEPYQGVMLSNPGGPGGSGITLPVLKAYVPNGGGDGYDWIGFDPRGVGDSEPALSCIPGYANGVRPPYEPTSRRIENAWLTLSKSYARACGANNGEILKHMTTVDAAKDMDAIRAAVGQEQINYYGFSYGTYLGQVYSTLYPSHVRRMVFDGTVDPRKIWYQANLDQDVAFEKSIAVFFTWVAKYDSVYHLGTTRKQVSARYYKEKAALTRHPSGDVGGSEWNDLLLYAGYYQSTWTELAGVFSAWAVDRNADALQEGYENYVASDSDNGYAVYSAVQCTDAKWPSSYRKYKADNRRVYKKAPFETWGNAWFNAPCLFWPVKAGTPLKISGKKVAGVLMINETLDAATPYPGSIEVRKRYPGARLIAEPGGTTHAGSLYGNACVDDRIAAYLKDGSLPARKSGARADVVCAPLPQPVPEEAATSDSSSARSAQGTGAAAAQSSRAQALFQVRKQALNGLIG